MSEMTALHGLYRVEPPTARTRTEYTVPGVRFEMKMFRVFGKMPASSHGPVPMQYCT
jgi:hypothetical protein